MDFRISIVVPTYNRLQDIRQCIEALERQDIGTQGFEVIVVDGGSADGTLGYLEGVASSTRMNFSYIIEKKKGAGAARNAGVMMSKADFIAFTDDDCIPGQGWLSELLASFPEDGKCAAVGGPIISAYKKNIISRYFDYCRVCRNLDFNGRAIHIPTMNVLYRRSVLLEVGIFDERIIITEDIHLSQKIIRNGYYMKGLEVGPVIHKDPRDLGSLYRKAWLHGTGVATIAMMQGVKLKRDKASLLKELIYPKKYVERFVKGQKADRYDLVVFEFLHRLWKLGAHNGYCDEVNRLHFKEIDAQ
jgi:glycosyltransferase involved in cell wall biosynthesis